MIKNVLILGLLVFPIAILATDRSQLLSDSRRIITVSSPENRVAVLELYTSEGCSSCPPAEHFLSSLKTSGISDRQLIPMAFHVTYWDYIGWQDGFAKQQYDRRQRDLAQKNNQATVYTPQFVLSGKDYRRYAHISEEVNKLIDQKATIDLILSASTQKNVVGGERLQLVVVADTTENEVNDIAIYFVVLEDDLSSDVSEGENKGKRLHHDYVVRQLSGPHKQGNVTRREYTQSFTLLPEWNRKNLSVVVFAENLKSGEVLQAVRLGRF